MYFIGRTIDRVQHRRAPCKALLDFSISTEYLLSIYTHYAQSEYESAVHQALEAKAPCPAVNASRYH